MKINKMKIIFKNNVNTQLFIQNEFLSLKETKTMKR